ncbi:MAG: protein kinase [Sedimentisphaerales bacterium]|nr:protein kinase [Sedimentisphaerales bacterium]
MTSEVKKEEMIFDAAIRFKSDAERHAYVTQACGDDSELRDNVESLLQAHESHSLLDEHVIDLGVSLDESPLTEQPGTVIGRYKLLEQIGEGGMAVVYMAEQQEPIRRKVALKVIKLGMDTKSVIARFEAERQALAMMDHPNIAKVLDAGATETGRPYFVMELVTGVTITEYCDKNNLNTKQRLELFIQVCNAVQHAHQKGIIHRDIKPSNIMVTHQDGKPMPKVIDFGIAKAINQKLTEKTLFTRYAHIIGTPAYMSPEQAELSDLDIDTRTDIYSLGVLLYELLTGTTPFSEEELREAGYIEMQRVIREQEPVRPSTKLSTLGGTLTDIAKHRSATPELLTKAIRGDLDWIVMKSLEKDRGRRYETANMLALDIQHHLGHEPVMARGPSPTYRLQKFLRRHRSHTIAALALLIIASVVVVILSMWRKDRLQLDEAEGFRHRGILSQAREQYAKAERDAALETIQPILRSRHVGPEAQLLHAGILVDNRRTKEAIAMLTDLLDKPPEIAGAAHSLLARILWESESPDAEKLKEIEQHRQKAQAMLPETAEAYFLRAMTAITIKEQLASLDRALQLDPGHYESRRLRAFTFYASRKYERLRDDALAMTILRPRDPLGYSLRAMALRELKKCTEAIIEYDNAIALTAKGSPEYIDLSVQRCETLLWMGDYKRLIADARECVKLSPNKPVFQYHIFSALTALGDDDKANTVFREIVGRTPTSRNDFRDWCAKYIFDTLEAGRSWHPADRKPAGADVSRASLRVAGILPASTEGVPPSNRGPEALGTRGRDARDTVAAAFLPMVEAEETYRELSSKARRLTTDGFSPRWSPDGSKLAFSAGVHGYSGVAVFDPATKETELLIVPGKDPMWSPDGKYIAFVRDCQLLRISEFIALEPQEQRRLRTDEEVWIMKADGTEPRRLARGGWPAWSQDSTCVYYHSYVDSALCSISVVNQDGKPRRVIKSSNPFPSISPDNQYIAYFEQGSLKIKDIVSQTIIAEQSAPFATWGGPIWSPTGQELCLAGRNDSEDRMGLWIYSLDQNEPLRILGGQITFGAWASDGMRLVFSLGVPYFDIWAADLAPNVSTTEALGPGKTMDEHVHEMLAVYNRRIKADPKDAYAYSGRAHYYDCLNDKAKVRADMKNWSAILSAPDMQTTISENIRRIINGPFNYQFVFSAERPVNETPILNIAFGQKPSGSFVQPGCDSSIKTAKKGRCHMKTFQIPIVSTSLLGLCLLSGLDTPPAHADFTLGTPIEIGTPIWSSGHDPQGSCFSGDGLELYFSSNRPGGHGGKDIWVATREAVNAPWGEPVNLGSPINDAGSQIEPGISPDGLELYFGNWNDWNIRVCKRPYKDAPWSNPEFLGPPVGLGSETGVKLSADGLSLYFSAKSPRPGSYGKLDIYVSMRATTADSWGEPINLGPNVNTPANDAYPCISSDGRVLFFNSDRPGSYHPSGYDIWVTRRATTSDSWGPPVNCDIINDPAILGQAFKVYPTISPDGSVLYFERGYDMWQSSITPIIDFNCDGVVDIADVGIMIEHWYMDYSLCDIGPMPWGDGIVDAQDLKVLAEHLFEEENPPTQ